MYLCATLNAAAARILVLRQTSDSALPIVAGPPMAPDNALTIGGAIPMANKTLTATDTDTHKPRNSFGMMVVKSVVAMTTLAAISVMNRTSTAAAGAIAGVMANRAAGTVNTAKTHNTAVIRPGPPER